MPRTPSRNPRLRKCDIEYFPLPKLNPALHRETLQAAAKQRISWELNKIYNNQKKKKQVVFTTFMLWDVFHPWAYQGLGHRGCVMALQPLVGHEPRKLIKFKVDSDQGTVQYTQWLQVFPDLWITKFGVGNIELETMGPTTNISCIYNVGDCSLRVSFGYSTIRAPTFLVTKKRHAPLAPSAALDPSFHGGAAV